MKYGKDEVIEYMVDCLGISTEDAYVIFTNHSGNIDLFLTDKQIVDLRNFNGY